MVAHEKGAVFIRHANEVRPVKPLLWYVCTMIRSINRRVLGIAFLCLAPWPCVGQESSPPTVPFCELLNNPERYNRTEVTIRATYKYGYEWSYLYCLTCLDKGKVWLEFPFDLDASATKALKRGPKRAGTVNVTLQGTFIKCGNCGHEGGYPFLFVASKASDVRVVVKEMKARDKEQAAEKQWACGGTNPR
jgi:hypothetical protein